jgi:hypothetical protein
MAMTGFCSQRSASAARRTMERLVPAWMMASGLDSLTSMMASRSSFSCTWAISIGLSQHRPLMAVTSKPQSSKNLRTFLSPTGQ